MLFRCIKSHSEFEVKGRCFKDRRRNLLGERKEYLEITFHTLPRQADINEHNGGWLVTTNSLFDCRIDI